MKNHQNEQKIRITYLTKPAKITQVYLVWNALYSSDSRQEAGESKTTCFLWAMPFFELTE